MLAHASSFFRCHSFSTMFRSRLQAFRPVIAYRSPRLALRPQPFVNSTGSSSSVYGAMRPMSATAGSGPNVEEAISNIEELFGAAKDEVKYQRPKQEMNVNVWILY